MKKVNLALVLLSLALLSACGGGGGGSSTVPEPTPSAATYTVGGTVSGLGSGKSFVLQNNGGDDLTVSSNISFTFSTAVVDGAGYAVTVKTQPTGQYCEVTGGSGTISGANVTGVSLTCHNSGSLVSLFGTGGIVITDWTGNSESATAVAIQMDGKIVAAGKVVARYNPDGTPDAGFGTNGKFSIPAGYNDASGVAIQSDGKIVIVTHNGSATTEDFAVIRLTSTGALDTTFDTDGIAITAVGSSMDHPTSIAIAPDGKIAAAGYTGNGSNFDIAVVRYNSDGSLDTSFDSDGKVTTAIGSLADYANAVAVQSDGKIIIAGHYHNGTKEDFAVVRYNTDGSLDSSFDTDGIATTSIGTIQDQAYAVAIQPGGKIVAAGVANTGVDFDFAAVRYNANGSLDASFGSNGIATADVGVGADYAYAVAVKPDGKILLGGSTGNGVDADFVIVRLNADGSLDTSFDSDGIVTTDISGNDYMYAMTLTAEDKIVAAGSSDGTFEDFAIVEYWQ